MARNADFGLKRNDLISTAYRKLGVQGDLDAVQLKVGIEILNAIIREEDATGFGTGTQLWALDESYVRLFAGQGRYGPGVSGWMTIGVSGISSLKQDIASLVSVSFRSTAGDDTALKLVTIERWEAISDKNSVGDPTHVYFRTEINPASQELWIWPVPTAVGTTSTVVGTDGKLYFCASGHTAATQNRPTSGADWRSFWFETRTAPSAAVWVSGTVYTNGKLLRYVYKTPLLDFDDPVDVVDMPKPWTRYFIYRLAHDLSPEYGIALDERGWIETEYLKARAMIFPSTVPQANHYRNRTMFY